VKNLRVNTQTNMLCMEYWMNQESRDIINRLRYAFIQNTRVEDWSSPYYLDPKRRIEFDVITGKLIVDGTCEIEIDLKQVLGMCHRAAFGKSKRCKDGPVTVKFKGKQVREWEREVPKG
jgi:hypothetical protein